MEALQVYSGEQRFRIGRQRFPSKLRIVSPHGSILARLVEHLEDFVQKCPPKLRSCSYLVYTMTRISIHSTRDASSSRCRSDLAVSALTLNADDATTSTPLEEFVSFLVLFIPSMSVAKRSSTLSCSLSRCRT